jgi:hypothetical protein
MIIRLSKKLTLKIKQNDLPVLSPDPNPFLDWHAHVFICNRTQYIMVTNTLSLFSVFMFGAGITHGNKFIEQMGEMLKVILHNIGANLIYQRIIIPNMKNACFAKVCDKKIIGSMNDNIRLAKYVLEADGPHLENLAYRVNKNIHSVTGYEDVTKMFLGMKVDGE